MMKSIIKYTLWGIGFAVILILLLTFSLNFIVNEKLEDIINYEKADRLYDYTFSDVNLNILSGNLEINGAYITPIKETVDSLNLIGDPKRIIFDGSLNSIKIIHLDIVELLFNQKVIIDSLLIINPKINIHINTSIKEKYQQEFTKDLISNSIHYGEIKHIGLKNATLKWVGKDNDSSLYFACDSVFTVIKNLHTIGSNNKIDSVVFSELLFKGKQFKVNTIKDFSLSAQEIDYCYSDNLLELKSIQLKNILNKKAFTENQIHEMEWLKINIKSVSLSSTNTIHWSTTGEIYVNKISIQEPSVLVYKDKRLKDPPFMEKKLPSYNIRRIPIPLLIDTIEVHNGTVTYQEIVEDGETPGEVSFTHFDVKAYHLSNIESVLKTNDLFSVAISAKFLGITPTEAHVTFHLNDSTDSFRATGTINNIDVTILNKTLVNMVFIEFQKGYVHSLSYDFTATNESANGVLDMHCTDLHIALLDTNELFQHHLHKNKPIEGLIANMVLKKNNIPNTKHYVQGNIHLMRPKNKGVPNYFWNALKSGLISTVVDPTLYSLIKKKHPKK